MVEPGNIAHARSIYLLATAHRDRARFQQAANILVQAFTREAVGRDAVAHHAAQLFARFEDRHAVPHARKEIRAGQTTRTAANDRHGTRGIHAARQRRDMVGRRMVDRVLFDAANVHGRIDQNAAAALFARMLADERTCGRKRIVLAHHVR